MEKQNMEINEPNNEKKVNSKSAANTSSQGNTARRKVAIQGMDALAKIREEERAKLEALKEKEREKTRIAVEKERARLEAELAKEIAELESQLEKARTTGQKAKISLADAIEELPVVNPTAKTTVKNTESSETVIKKNTKPVTKKATSTKPSSKKVEKITAPIEELQDLPSLDIPALSDLPIAKPDKEQPIKSKGKIQEPIAEAVLPDKEPISISETPIFPVDLPEASVESPVSSTSEISGQEPVIPVKTETRIPEVSLEAAVEENKAISQEPVIPVQTETKIPEISLEAAVEENKNQEPIIPVQTETNVSEISQPVPTAIETPAGQPVFSVDIPLADTESTAKPVTEMSQENPVLAQASDIPDVAEPIDKVVSHKSATDGKRVILTPEQKERAILALKEKKEKERAILIKQKQLERALLAKAKEQQDLALQKQLEETRTAPKYALSEEKEKSRAAAEALLMAKEQAKAKDVELSLLKPREQVNTMASTQITNDDKSQATKNAINTLQKLREKIAAQKQLEKELMEKEALRVQEKSMQEKFAISKFDFDEEDAIVSADELEEERLKVEQLTREKSELVKAINDLRKIVDKIVNLQVSGVRVIDPNTYDLTPAFMELGLDISALNKTIFEVEEELDSLTSYHEKYAKKLLDAENAYMELETLYHQQEIVIKGLNEEIRSLKEQVLREKAMNKEKQILLEKIQAESKNNERTISAYRKQLETKYQSPETKNTEALDILNELDRLRGEIKQMMAADEMNKVKDLLETKDLEIMALSAELEKLEQEKEEASKTQQKPQQEMFVPYYACPQAMFMPRSFAQFPNADNSENDVYLQEIRKLREEIEKIKSSEQKPVKEPAPKNPVEAVPSVPGVDPYVMIQEFRDELSRNREEMQKFREEREKLHTQKEKEIERISETYKNVIEEKEKALTNEKDNNQKKIQMLEEMIKEKDELLEKMNQDVKRLTEDDIIDPEFKRKIRVIRDMKKELEERSAKEEEAFKENQSMVKDKISAKQLEIDTINDKMFKLEVTYKEKHDFSSAAKDAFEKTKGKLFVELQLQQERLHGLEEDLERLNSKYEQFVAKKDTDIIELNNNEIQTVEYYLNKLRQDYTYGVNYRKYKATEMERDDLAKQLGELKSGQSDDSEEEKNEEDDDQKNQVDVQIKEAENDIRELTREYNEYYRKLTELKAELEKRLEFEKRLRTNEEDVYDYYTSKVNLEECISEFQAKTQQGEDKQAELSTVSKDENARNEQLKLRAEIQDIEIHKEDLRNKIDYYKTHISELEQKEIVQKYVSVLSQIEKIRSVQKEQREEAEKIKSIVKSKSAYLEKLKNGK